MSMRQAQLDEIKARCDAATPGTWLRVDTETYAEIHLADTPLDSPPISLVGNSDNAEFISYARTDIPALLAEVERLREAQRWIPVSERLPEINKFVLLNCTFQPEHEQVSIGYLYQPDDKRRKPYFQWIGYDNWPRSFAKAHFICPGCENITHWMPLPEPYKEGEVDE